MRGRQGHGSLHGIMEVGPLCVGQGALPSFPLFSIRGRSAPHLPVSLPYPQSALGMVSGNAFVIVEFVFSFLFFSYFKAPLPPSRPKKHRLSKRQTVLFCVTSKSQTGRQIDAQPNNRHATTPLGTAAGRSTAYSRAADTIRPGLFWRRSYAVSRQIRSASPDGNESAHSSANGQCR